MKRVLYTNKKIKLSDKQLSFLQKIIDEGFELRPREQWVVLNVLKTGVYYENNYQYHLNNIGKRYTNENRNKKSYD